MDKFNTNKGDEVIQEEVFIGEMAAIKGGFKNVKLAVWGSEGNGYPHFHFYRGVAPNAGIPNKGQGGGCILFEKPNYFHHKTHTEYLTKRESKELVPFLKAKHETGGTNWQFILGTWNGANPGMKQFPMDTPIPNYKYDMIDCHRKEKDVEMGLSKATPIQEAKEDRYPKVGPFYFYKGKIIAPEEFQRRINPTTFIREFTESFVILPEHRDMWDKYMTKHYPELKTDYDDNHKALPRGRVDYPDSDAKNKKQLSFFITLDKCIKGQEDAIKRAYHLENYPVKFIYGAMNYRCKHCSGKPIQESDGMIYSTPESEEQIRIMESQYDEVFLEMADVRGKDVKTDKINFSFYFSAQNSSHWIRVKIRFNPEGLRNKDFDGYMELHGNFKWTPNRNVPKRDVELARSFFKKYIVLFNAVWNETLYSGDVIDFFRCRMSFPTLLQQFKVDKEIYDAIQKCKDLQTLTDLLVPKVKQESHTDEDEPTLEVLGEMAQVDINYSERTGSAIKQVYVYQRDEGNIPHVHIKFVDKGDHVHEASVCLHDNVYAWWHYKGSRPHSMLNSGLKKELNQFFNTTQTISSTNERGELISVKRNNWMTCVVDWLNTWGDPNNMFKRDENNKIIMPDYKHLSFPTNVQESHSAADDNKDSGSMLNSAIEKAAAILEAYSAEDIISGQQKYYAVHPELDHEVTIPITINRVNKPIKFRVTKEQHNTMTDDQLAQWFCEDLLPEFINVVKGDVIQEAVQPTGVMTHPRFSDEWFGHFNLKDSDLAKVRAHSYKNPTADWDKFISELGCHYFRWGIDNRGGQGGLRIVHAFIPSKQKMALITCYAKNDARLTKTGYPKPEEIKRLAQRIKEMELKERSS